MHFLQGEVYHVYNRGNNKQHIFFNDRNYCFFLQKVRIQLFPVCEILAWCLMPNHFHFMIYATPESCVERPSFGGKPMQELPHQIGKLLSSYSQAINKQNNTIGSLFQQKTKAKCLTSSAIAQIQTPANHLVNCVHYIHQNPIKAGLVEQMEDWRFSSFAGYTGINTPLECNSSRLFKLTGYDQLSFYKDRHNVIDPAMIKDLF
jgi:putative transposase